MQARKLPLGIQDFEELRRGGYLYVDKTDMLWQIANGDKYNYLSRPRRFGKSLLTSALHCYFEGRCDLFDGLKIMQLEKQWVVRPVIHLSMNLGGSTCESLESYLDDTLLKYEAIYGKRESERTLGNRLTGIIHRAYEQSGVQIAVLVDEYDAPLQHSFGTLQHDSCRQLYRDFFTGLKDYGYCIKCVFLTGITKFTQISLFSVLNTLSNISFRSDYATLCGMTSAEIAATFAPELHVFAEKRGCTTDELLADMKDMYDGYHFSYDMVDVYNPFSVLNAVCECRLKSYWVASGANEMLFKILNNFTNDITHIDGCMIDADYLETSDANLSDPKLFLYQAGYLTIKAVQGDSYVLGLPNREVRKALYGMVLPIMLGQEKAVTDNAIQEMKHALVAIDTDCAMLCLQQLVAGTPYSTQKKEQFAFEEHFRFILKNLFYICGFDVNEEVQTSCGRIDITVLVPSAIYILELKMDDEGGVDAAATQIVARHYAEKYAASHKPVICLALEFERKGRRLKRWTRVNI